LMVGLTIVILGSARKWYRVLVKQEPHSSPMAAEAAT
jgi:hypothetical protein